MDSRQKSRNTNVRASIAREISKLLLRTPPDRAMMVRAIIDQGISDPLVLQAMCTVPRHLFVTEALRAQAYEDSALPIEYGDKKNDWRGRGQTISRPYVVALMSQLLEARKGMHVLEIGTGSGYQAAVLRDMELHVHSVEHQRELHFRTCDLFLKLKYTDICVKLGDGTQGWPEAAPFDRIIVTAGGPEIPQPLVEQLRDPGILVLPVGQSRQKQNLIRVRKQNGAVYYEHFAEVSFVELVGRYGWEP